MPRIFTLPPFLGRTMPVELVAELQSVSVVDSAIRLRCQTKRFEPQVHGYYGTDCETVLCAPQPGRLATVQLDICSDEVFRLRYAPGDVVPDGRTPMVFGQFDGPSHLEWQEEEGGLAIWTAALRIEVVREPWQLCVYARDGRLVWRSRPLDIEPFRRPEHQWSPHEQRWLFYHRYAYPLGSADHGEHQHAFLSFDLHYDEHIYGFGECYGRLDKRQTHQQLWHVEALSNASTGSYKSIPFFMSTRGYGLFANTSHGLDVHVGDREHTAISLTVEDSTTLDCYLIYGPSLREILPRYTAITGQPTLPPKWSFGLWMGRISYNRQEQVESVARNLRQHRIPCDVIHIDTDWYEKEWAYGPEAEAIVRHYAELRYRLLPYIYSEAVESCRSSLPMIRALVLAFQDDPNAVQIEDQYLFGRFLLVAPILDESNRRRVYLPQGRWFDYWSKEQLEGGRWIGVEAPLEVLPLYVPAGAMLPYGPLLQYVDEKPNDPLTVELYMERPATLPSDASYTIHDQGQPDITVAYRLEEETLRVATGPAPGQLALLIYGLNVAVARLAGQPLAVDHLTDGGCRVVFDGRQPRTVTLTIT